MTKRTIKLTLEYDGTEFVGWQSQQNGRSVQDVVEAALQTILQTRVRIIGAGRTDAGVHALGQVASFQTETSLHCERLGHSLNGLLPEDVVALSVEDAPPEFHARYDARARRYRYVIKRRPTAVDRKYCWSLGYHLDVGLMRQCAAEIVGPHDFRAFCNSESTTPHHRCDVFDATWTEPDPQTVIFDITADRFLHGMVRALVGTVVEIGRGYRPKEDLRAILASGDRRNAGVAAPPQGLFLVEVQY